MHCYDHQCSWIWEGAFPWKQDEVCPIDCECNMTCQLINTWDPQIEYTIYSDICMDIAKPIRGAQKKAKRRKTTSKK